MGTRFPGESAEYRAARDQLLAQEIELRRAMEALAVARREQLHVPARSRRRAAGARGRANGPPAARGRPLLNVFHRDGGTIRHFWGAELTYGPSDPDKLPSRKWLCLGTRRRESGTFGYPPLCAIRRKADHS